MDSDKRVKISVITPSVRDAGIPLVKKSLSRQTFPKENFEHIVQGREGNIKGNVWTFNQDMNIALRKAKGELIISWQDYTYAKPDTLQRFWTHYEQEPKTLIGAVGNKYQDDDFIVQIWQDPRERDDQGSYYPCYFSDIEWNLCSVPKQALYDVGGFDEEMDKKYGMDGYSVNDRINILGGYDFKLDQSIKSYSLDHGRLNGDDWDKNNWNGRPYLEYRKRYIENPILNYI